MANTIHHTNYFDRWFEKLDKTTQGRINRRVTMAKKGYFGETETSGGGIAEMKLRFGPGYRLYYFQREQSVYFLLIGGIKDTQQRDFEMARAIKQRIERGEIC